MWVLSFPNISLLYIQKKNHWWIERLLTDGSHVSMDPQPNEQLVQLGLLSWGDHSHFLMSEEYVAHCLIVHTVPLLLTSQSLSDVGPYYPKCSCQVADCCLHAVSAVPNPRSDSVARWPEELDTHHRRFFSFCPQRPSVNRNNQALTEWWVLQSAINF